MARALLGHVGPAHDQILALEIARLRRRVAELETENAALRETATVTLPMPPMNSIDLDDIELHRMAEGMSGIEVAEPALA